MHRLRNTIVSGGILAFFLLVSREVGVTAELKFVTQDFAPFTYPDEKGEPAGLGVEIVRRVCQEAKIEASIRLLAWVGAQKLVQEGKADGMFLIGWNKEREKTLIFSPPVLLTEYGFFVRDDNPLEYRSPEDVKGYSVGVYGPSNTSTTLEAIRDELQDLTIDMTPDDESAFRKLSMGRVKAVFSNHDVGVVLCEKLGLKNIRYAGRHKELKYFIGFSRQHANPELVSQFNEAFRKLYAEGVIPEILQKYHLTPVPVESPQPSPPPPSEEKKGQ